MGGGGGGGGEEATSLKYTATWVVALVCTVIVAISFAAERLLHYTGKFLVKKKQWPLFEALLKIKEELMLLGFISLLLTVFQDRISTICIPKHLSDDWLPCKLKDNDGGGGGGGGGGGHRRLLAAAADAQGHCERVGKRPLLSLKALHDLHIFIFVLAAVHVLFSALTILFGTLQIRQWKHWEDAIHKKEAEEADVEEQGAGVEGRGIKVTHIHHHDFIKGRFLGIGKDLALLSWLHSFLKQFYASVSELDYTTLRRGFIHSHYRENPKFNFYKYMVRALETDFKKVVGISWYLWVFVLLFLLLNVHGWHAYFWIAFVPLILVVGVGAKLEHVITQLARDVAEKHVAIPGELVVQPSDHHFWFNKPRLVLILIHIILFQNSFEIAVFFWVFVLFGFDSCIMGQVGYIIPRLIIGVVVQLLCSYSTLPLYAIVAQMGSSFNKAIFEDHIQTKITGWAQKAKMNNKKGKGKSKGNNLFLRKNNNNERPPSPSQSEAPPAQDSTTHQSKQDGEIQTIT